MEHDWKAFALEVDLSKRETEKQEIDPEISRAFLGGQGINAKILWDRVSPEVDPFSPENLLIVGTGVLVGTMAFGANRTTVTYKSPVSNRLSWSTMGGFMATEIKSAGYDNIVISGKSSEPVYLWIHDDQVEIRSAAHIWGKNVQETQQLIREELDNDKVQVMSIGKAGENKVNMASIEHSIGASASRGGAGAIMGDKKLKAIAVYGTKSISVANSSKVNNTCDQISDRLKTCYDRFPTLLYGTRDGGLLITPGLFHEARMGYFEPTLSSKQMEDLDLSPITEKMHEFMDQKMVREVACQNCPFACKYAFRAADGGYTYYKCQAMAAVAVTSKIIDFDFSVTMLNFCQTHGLDVMSLMVTIAFAIDLYEKGILTKSDTEGKHLEWENPEIILWLANKIVDREGIGDALAHDVYNAARHIGKGAEEFGYNVKKYTQLPFLVPAPWYGLITAVSEKGDLTRLESLIAAIYGVYDENEYIKELMPGKEEYLDSGLSPFPEEYWKYFKADFGKADDEETIEALCQIAAFLQEMYPVSDATGLCTFWTIFMAWHPIARSHIVDLVAGVTGLDVDADELMRMAKRTLCLVRGYNARSGNSRKDDSLPKTWFEESPRPSDKSKPVDPILFNKWVDKYYELRGWNNNGIPSKETLENLGLDYVIKELEDRGVLQ